MKKESISVVLPTYNEKKNIEILIPQLEATFKDYDIEIIIVDDSSPDGTAQAAQKLNETYGNIRVVLREKLEGIGAALRDGYDVAKNDLILSSDADLSFSIKDMLKLVRKVKRYDMVVGSRYGGSGSYEMNTPKIMLKGLVSKLGNKFNKLVTGVNVNDFTANFRITRRKVWLELGTTDKTNFILAEMIILAHKKGYRITEIPISFKDRIHGESKLQLAREIPKFIVKMLKYSFTKGRRE